VSSHFWKERYSMENELNVSGKGAPLRASVVIPAYNAGRTINEALSSVLSAAEVEVIVCDDASTDDTSSIIMGVEDLRISLLVNEVNCGPGPSRDNAIRQASAPWVAFLDADDTWHPDRLSCLISAAEKMNADVVFDDVLLCHDTAGGLVPWKPLHGRAAFGGKGDVPRIISIENYVSSRRLLIQPVIRSDFIRKHGVSHGARRFAEDAEFYLRLASAGARFCYVPSPLYNYRITRGSLTAQAKDPSLMRKCLEECSKWNGWSVAVQGAFHTKIASLRENEALHDLARDMRKGRFVQVFRSLARQPRLLTMLPRKILQQLHYQAHRAFHGGYGR